MDRKKRVYIDDHLGRKVLRWTLRVFGFHRIIEIGLLIRLFNIDLYR